MMKPLLLALLLLTSFYSKGQTLLNESFNGTTFPPTGWTTTSDTATWSRVTAGISPTQLPHSGAGEAKLNAKDVPSGNFGRLITPAINLFYASGTNTVTFWMYRDSSFSTINDRLEVFINTSTAYTGGTLLGTINRSTILTPSIGTFNNWYEYTFTIPASFNTATNYIIFRGVSAGGNNIYIDDVSVTHLPQCNTPAPTPNNITYCQFDVVQPLSAQGLNILWYTTPTVSGTSPLGSGSTTAPTPSTAVPGLFVYYASQTIGCESPRVAVNVLVRPKPAPPTTATAIFQYCQFEPSTQLSAFGTAVRWFSTPTGGTGSATAPSPSTLVPGTYFYYASQTVGGCESDRAIITVIVKAKPAPPTVVSPLNICQGAPIAPVTAQGQNLLWYTTSTGGVGVPLAPMPNTGYEDSFRYFVSQTVDGCESDRALLVVYINYRPNGVITGSSASVCSDENDTFYYYGNARPDAEYNWYAPITAHGLAGGNNQGPFIVHFDSAGISTIRLTINNKGCISTLISAPIVVRPLPVITFINRQDACEGELVNVGLTSYSNNISGYHWYFGADDIDTVFGGVTTGGPFGIRYPEAGHYSISATATSGGCTSKPIFQDIYVHELPNAKISTSKLPIGICSSDTLQLRVAQVPEGATYIWTPSAYFQGKQDTLNSTVYAVISQTSMVKVHIKTAYGCEATDSVAVTTKPCCGVYFPNAFAPSGTNRLFRPITSGIHRINSFQVVNRWGQTVYESKIERNGWDGTLNGVPQDMGTYHYYINYVCEGKNVEEHGEFMLIR